MNQFYTVRTGSFPDSSDKNIEKNWFLILGESISYNVLCCRLPCFALKCCVRGAKFKFIIVLCYCRTCHTRRSTGTRHASCAPSAAPPSWTSSSAPRPTASTAGPATTHSSPPGATAAATSSGQVGRSVHAPELEGGSTGFYT